MPLKTAKKINEVAAADISEMRRGASLVSPRLHAYIIEVVKRGSRCMNFENPDYDSAPALRTIAMPADTNANGDIFGGWLLSQMDLAGSVIAHKTAGTRVATIAIDGMSFKQPVSVGDEVSCYAKVEKIGRTSITIHVESWARPRLAAKAHKVTEGKFTYVAIDENRKPVPVLRDQ